MISGGTPEAVLVLSILLEVADWKHFEGSVFFFLSSTILNKHLMTMTLSLIDYYKKKNHFNSKKVEENCCIP